MLSAYGKFGTCSSIQFGFHRRNITENSLVTWLEVCRRSDAFAPLRTCVRGTFLMSACDLPHSAAILNRKMWMWTLYGLIEVKCNFLIPYFRSLLISIVTRKIMSCHFADLFIRYGARFGSCILFLPFLMRVMRVAERDFFAKDLCWRRLARKKEKCILFPWLDCWLLPWLGMNGEKVRGTATG